METTPQLLPTGALLAVKDTEFDYTESKQIGEIKMDQAFVLNKKQQESVLLFSEDSGIQMKVTTNQPSVVVYTPDTLDAICFETQNYPDAPNYNHFPSSVLRPEEKYLNKSSFEFRIRK